MTATLIGFTGIVARAETPELFPLLPQWEPVFTLRSGGGFKDNVFLSPTQPQSSAFVSGGGDVMVLRLSPSGPQFSLFASGDVNYYIDPSHTESTAFALARLDQDFNETWKGSLAAEYLFQDQFLDVAYLDAGTNLTVSATAVRGHTLTLRPGVEVALPSQFSLALETPVTRAYYDEPLDDYWHGGLKLTLARSHGYNSQLSLSYEPAWRFYDNDPALTSTGKAIPGTLRERFQHEALLAWRQHWDELKRWRSTVRVGGRFVWENGEGYADQTQWFASAQLRYRAGQWEASAEGRVRYYDYQNQTVSPTDPSARRRTEWSAGFRIERELTKQLSLIASYDHEQTLSNDEAEAYTVNTVSGSLQWEF